VARLTTQVRTPLIVPHVSARAVQKILAGPGVHVSGSGSGGGSVGVPLADAAWTAGEAVDAAAAGAAVDPTTSANRTMTALIARAMRASIAFPASPPWPRMARAYAAGRTANNQHWIVCTITFR